MRLALCFLIAFLSAPPTIATAQEGFVELVQGDSLENWKQHGGEADYEVQDGMVIGTSKADTPNSFLCTTKEYGDFVLELDVKVDDELNSGIQIRSHVYDEEKQVEVTNEEGDTRTITIPPGRVHGYQVEIDPSDRAYSGGIYDEARRGWLYDLSGEENKKAREAFKRGEWNHYRIEADGDRIQTWINGVKAADLTDDMDSSGLIALQVHSVPDRLAGKQVRWKNVRIKEK